MANFITKEQKVRRDLGNFKTLLLGEKSVLDTVYLAREMVVYKVSL